MVSKANEDLPLPDRPVITTSRSRGSVKSTFLRLCCRAPRISILSKGMNVYRISLQRVEHAFQAGDSLTSIAARCLNQFLWQSSPAGDPPSRLSLDRRP